MPALLETPVLPIALSVLVTAKIDPTEGGNQGLLTRGMQGLHGLVERKESLIAPHHFSPRLRRVIWFSGQDEISAHPGQRMAFDYSGVRLFGSAERQQGDRRFGCPRGRLGVDVQPNSFRCLTD